jgi:hypothetical protein
MELVPMSMAATRRSPPSACPWEEIETEGSLLPIRTMLGEGRATLPPVAPSRPSAAAIRSAPLTDNLPPPEK